jgi:hypothetical protein
MTDKDSASFRSSVPSGRTPGVLVMLKVHHALVCDRVRIAVADGCVPAQECLMFLATGRMQNLLWCGRDRAHALRIPTSEPWLAEECFKAWWDDTFNASHTLVPDIQNSEERLAKLALAQKQVLKSSGVQGSDVKAIATTLSFAKQRFDAMASQQLICCIIFVAIAMLSAFQARSFPRLGRTSLGLGFSVRVGRPRVKFGRSPSRDNSRRSPARLLL